MEKYQYGWEPVAEDLQYMEENLLRSREQLLGSVRERRAYAQNYGRTDPKHSAAYYGVLDSLFEKLLAGIENLMLFDQLEPCWAYSFSIDSRGATVWLQHVAYLAPPPYRSVIYNASYQLLNISCRMLSVDEFAKIYGVERGTVLQWIRRGKIRSVRRSGKEWRISELTELPGRKYVAGSYSWREELTDLPEEYAWLREPAAVLIGQDEENGQEFFLSIIRDSAEPQKELIEGISAKEREKIELMLLSHPLVNGMAADETIW